MKWFKYLFLGEQIIPKSNKIITKIKKRKLTPNVYIIALASNPNNLLDIIPSLELLQSGYPIDEIHIIGLAFGKEEAVDLVCDIISEVHQSGDLLNVKVYLENKWGDDIWN